jgi:hypothetical protein
MKMNKKSYIIIASTIGVLALSFSAYLIKKAFIDKGFEKSKERDTYLMLYIIANGEKYNDQSIKKYENLSTEEIKKRLEDIENVKVTDDEFFQP